MAEPSFVEMRIAKCSVRDDSFVEPCSTLREVAQTGMTKAKGILWHHLVKDAGSRFEPSRSFFIARSGDFARDGVILNFCPFCGTSISAPITSRHAQINENANGR